MADLLAVSGRPLKQTATYVLDYLIGPRYVDSRTQDWPLVSSRAAVAIPALYVLAVPIARKIMADRKPVDVRAFVMWHNFSMALLSLWMVVETISSQFTCAAWDKKLLIWGTVAEAGNSFSPACRRLAVVLYVHYLSKVVEFTDTFIMVLKRNDHQISFLHVYHHASTFLCWWVAITFTPGGDAYFTCAINSFVHVIMYSYYFVANSKAVRIPLVVKKSITTLQMMQFGLILTQALYGTFWARHFRPKIVVVLALTQGVVFMILFGNFFRKAYLGKTAGKGVGNRTPPKMMS